MFAIIETGGKQYKVEKGSTFEMEKVSAKDGESFTIDKVLLLSDKGNLQIGKPLIDGAAVMARVVNHFKGEKLRIYKMKPKDHYQRTTGHRQKYTTIEITDINNAAIKATKTVKETETPKPEISKKTPVKKAASKKAPAKKSNQETLL